MSDEKMLNKEIIRTKDDLFKMLDVLMEQRESEWWNRFYSDREKEIPFFKNKPDENLVDYIENDYFTPGKLLEIGCGPGRNAIYLAKNSFRVDAIDYSEVSIEWAKERADEAKVSVGFHCLSFFDYDVPGETYDYIYDSGVLHHIKPHKRFDYLKKVWDLLKPNAYFGLVCFNLQGGANISDYDVYREYSMKGGLGFSEFKLKEVLTPFFEIVEFRQMKKTTTNEFGEEFLWTVLMKKKDVPDLEGGKHEDMVGFNKQTRNISLCRSIFSKAKKGGIKNMEQRIILAAATDEDVNFLVDEKTNASLWQYEDFVPRDKEDVGKKIIERINSDWYKQYLIKLNNKEQTAIGELHMHRYVKERESWEIGYCIFPEYRGQGYCAEAAKLALKYAFEDWNAHKVVAMCNEYNVASYKVMEKIGMTREGVFRAELPWRGKWVNQLFYCILDDEYRNK